MQKQKSILTADGSHTLFSKIHGAYYHSMNGALTESQHIFINSGFKHLSGALKQISILEIGLGTGLNAALTASESLISGVETLYTGLELYPITEKQIKDLNYSQILNPEVAECWSRIMLAEWNSSIEINQTFRICKVNEDFTKWIPVENFSLIYFDAFAPDDQPEMWSVEMFQKLFSSLSVGGVLVTYSSKGIVKQALRAAGFRVERLAGPPGKRHILRAVK
ncbi:MAG TPA: tRNA (5-methylaminomethyl-2-thiouridine)(34)-methyltransferase MnmD [Tenuifilaceae bacterium]|nr:tRNA (5-methylaminomethyl-2-thiouridine)(34)-methyltransferase MnmD [Tenuifilaceae bacterium]HOZ14906.1 tRNA (5-methylaminomethyl-2-thiouridine)(34)-methyltransferase MnmD [Tenuifilaceae bacterium]HPI45684.1 tRNA (5-methylaminomethyl-2-thiouridine)(34)-methyltransferase MnmD [Tenuifilaceae bacterium]HPN20289.1 tRNA (5-methylaminomethyl-2-thiouridine)(34)-methyltransferase MnmD [Tenuifilaceae bacterium]HPV55992.1 tRNA (5-methylaminomethyl-2-thiouridine)(34)-methyltransferase MnmD [Tenuifilace